MGVTNIDGLKRLSKRVNAISNTNLSRNVGEAMFDRAAFEISKYYPDAQIYSAYTSGITTINATAPGLWFREFGTGIVGKGTYQGTLPTTTLVFDSRGESQTTKGWEYEYHPETQKIHGWFYGNTFTRGAVAKSGIYFTARYLRLHSAEIVKEMLRSVGR